MSSGSGSPCEVSVIIATFRREKLVLEALASALSQDGVSVEAIVVDDSPDASARKAIESVRDPRVRYLVHAPPTGGKPGSVRNEGARHARGRFVHFLDDDDRLADGALRALVDALTNSPHLGMAFGRVVPFGDNERILARETAYFDRAARNAARIRGRKLRFALQMLFGEGLFVNSACMVSREVFSASGGYDTSLAIAEDTEFYLRVGRAHGFAFVDRPVLHYRTGGESLTSAVKSGGWDERVLVTYGTMYEKYRRDFGVSEFLALKVLGRLSRLPWIQRV